MELDINSLSMEQVTPVMLTMIMKKLNSLEEMVKTKVAYLTTEEAIEVYTSNHVSRMKSPVGVKGILEKIKTQFAGRNISEITPEEVESFLQYNYGTNAQSVKSLRHAQLRGFFGWCSTYLKRKHQPSFENPCSMVEMVGAEAKPPQFFTTESIRSLIEATISEDQWLLVSIMATSGMRPDEVAEIKVVKRGDRRLLVSYDTGKGSFPEGFNPDVIFQHLPVPEAELTSRCILIFDPKSCRYNRTEKYCEIAIIPQVVADRLWKHVGDRTGRVFGGYSSLFKKIKAIAKRAGVGLSPKNFRSACATYWYGKDDAKMVAFTLRHKSVTMKTTDGTEINDPIARRYVVMPIGQALERQEVMERDLFGVEG